MKNLVLITLSFLFTTSAFSQNFLGMKVLKYGIALGNDQDRVQGLDAQYLMGLSRTPVSSELRDNDFEPINLVSMTCENPALRFAVTVQPFKTSSNWQLDLGTTLMSNRIDGTDYRYVNYGSSTPDNTFSFRSRSHEIALDASLLRNVKFGFFNLYGGIGTNLGMTFAGDMTIRGNIYNEISDPVTGFDDPLNVSFENERFYEYSSIKNVLHQRAFLQGGMSIIILKRLELGVDARLGVGYRLNRGNSIKTTNLFGGGFVAKWNLK